MKIGILDIGTNKISCFIVNILKDKEPIILGIGHHQSNGVSSGSIVDMELACNSIRSSIQSAEKMFGDTVEEFVVNISSNTIKSYPINLNINLMSSVDISFHDGVSATTVASAAAACLRPK